MCGYRLLRLTCLSVTLVNLLSCVGYLSASGSLLGESLVAPSPCGGQVKLALAYSGAAYSPPPSYKLVPFKNFVNTPLEIKMQFINDSKKLHVQNKCHDPLDKNGIYTVTLMLHCVNPR